MTRGILLLAASLAIVACSRQTNPAPTPESQADNAAASAPNGVGSQRGVTAPATNTAPPQTGQATTPPSATAEQQARDTSQSATSRSSADQQGVTASPPR